MDASNFVHLHLHTDYSLLDGACEIGELTAEAARRGMPAVAVTDHGNLFAAANFYHQATTHGVKPIIGCEMYVAPDNHKNRGTGAERSNHLVLLCENEKGYQNLIKLVSTGYLDGFYYKPRVDHELLAKHSEGLIALSACLRGEVADALLSDKYDQAQKSAYRLRDIFGKQNFFLEVQDQGLEQDIRVNRDLVRLSKESGIPLVATNDCHYLTKADSHAQEVLMCIQTGKTMSDPQRMKFATDQFYFKTAQEMAHVFRELPDAVTRTIAIADRCNVKIQRVSNPFPEFKVPEGHTTDSYFERVVREGFISRAPQIERLTKEGRLRHPLDKYAGRLKDLNASELATMESRKNNEDIVVAGIIVQIRPMRSRRGARWAILTLQDRTGVIEALVFPEAFGKLEGILKSNTPLLVKGRVAVEDVGTRLMVADARLLDQLADRPPSMLRVRMDLSTVNTGAIDQLQKLFSSRPGRCKVSFELVKDDGSAATLDAGSAVLADRELVERVREICGTDSVALVQ